MSQTKLHETQRKIELLLLLLLVDPCGIWGTRLFFTKTSNCLQTQHMSLQIRLKIVIEAFKPF